VKPFAIHDAAEVELRQAIEWYEAQREGLGGEFREAFEAAVGRIRDFPMLHAAEDETGTRLAPIRRFPYAIVYLDEEDRIWIVAVADQRRREGYWARRLPS